MREIPRSARMTVKSPHYAHDAVNKRNRDFATATANMLLVQGPGGGLTFGGWKFRTSRKNTSARRTRNCCDWRSTHMDCWSFAGVSLMTGAVF